MHLKDILQGKTSVVYRKTFYSDVKKSRHIAIAFRKNGSMITIATNRLILGQSNKFSNHAEEALIFKLRKLKAKQRFGNIIVIVMRWSSATQYSLSRPCKVCQRLLEEYGIDTILFTTNEGCFSGDN